MSVHWRRWARQNASTLVTLAVIAFLVVSASMLASEVLEDETGTVDDMILRAMRDDSGAPIGPHWFQRAIIDLSALGSTAVATSVVIVACVFLLLARRRHHAMLVAACGLGTALAITLLKDYIGRDRPDIVRAIGMPGGFSFPSGHTFTASAIYPLLGYSISRILPTRSLRLFVLGVSAATVFVVGFSRVYLGVHYPTDVVAGWAWGLAWAIACALVGTRFAPLSAGGTGPSLPAPPPDP